MPILTIHWNAYTGPCCNPENPCDLSDKRVPHSRTSDVEYVSVNEHRIYAPLSDGSGCVLESLKLHHPNFDGAICGFEVRD